MAKLKKINIKYNLDNPVSLLRDCGHAIVIHLIVVLLMVVFSVSNYRVKREQQIIPPIQNNKITPVAATIIDQKMVEQAVKRQKNKVEADLAQEKKIKQQQQELDKLKKLAEQEVQKAKQENQKIQRDKDRIQKEQQRIAKTNEELKTKQQELAEQKAKLIKQQIYQQEKKKP